MTELQKIIHRRLGESAPVLADLYEAALLLIEMSDFPGRGYFIAHACREIRNSLAEAYGAPSDPEIKIGKTLALKWRANVSPDVPLVGGDPMDPITVPLELAQRIDKMVTREIELETIQRRRFSNMCDVINPSTLKGFTDPTIANTWIRSRPHKLAHVKRGSDFTTRPADEAINSFREIEQVLGALYAPADEVIPQLEDLIREANE